MGHFHYNRDFATSGFITSGHHQERGMSGKLWIVGLLAVVFGAAVSLSAQNGARNNEWRTYGGEPGNTKYSPLDQITKENAKNLRIAWRFKTDNLGAPISICRRCRLS